MFPLAAGSTSFGLNAPGSSDAMLSMLQRIGQRGTTAPTAPVGSGLGMNLDTLQLGLAGIGTLGNLWAAFEARNLAKKQFDFTKRVTSANMNNQVQSYNTALADRARSRAAVENRDPSTADEYINKNRLTTGGM